MDNRENSIPTNNRKDLEKAIKGKTSYPYLLSFCEKKLCSEGVKCLKNIYTYEKNYTKYDDNKARSKFEKIREEYVREGSISQANISNDNREEILQIGSAEPLSSTIFSNVKEELLTVVLEDVWFQYKHSEEYLRSQEPPVSCTEGKLEPLWFLEKLDYPKEKYEMESKQKYWSDLFIVTSHVVSKKCKGIKILEKMLDISPKEINEPNREGSTPLHVASNFGSKRVVALLLRYGANPNKSNTFGDTPLSLAASKKHSDVVTLLKKGGYKRGIKNSLRTGLKALKKRRSMLLSKK